MRTFSARVGFAVMLIGFGAAIGMFWMAGRLRGQLKEEPLTMARRAMLPLRSIGISAHTKALTVRQQRCRPISIGNMGL